MGPTFRQQFVQSHFSIIISRTFHSRLKFQASFFSSLSDICAQQYQSTVAAVMSWLADDSGLVQVDGASLTCSGAKKANAIFAGEDAEGVSCWEFDIKNGEGFWVGMATQENFGSGYKLKGLMYGGPGNLSDGGALLKGKWGPRFGAGDKIKMRLEVVSDSASIAFAKNG